MKRLLSALITVSILATSGLFVYADEEDGLIPEEVLIEDETSEYDEEYDEEDETEAEDIEAEAVLSETSDEDEPSIEPVDTPEEISSEDIETTDMDLVEVSSQRSVFVDGEFVEDDITVEYVDASEVDASTTTVYTSISAAGDFVRAAAAKRDDSITFRTNDSTLTSDNIMGRVRSVLFKHTGIPGQGDNIYYQLYGFTVSWWGNSSSTEVIIELTYYTSASQETKLSQEISKVLSSLNIAGKSNTCKICAIYDYICQNVEYDYDHLNDDDYLLQYTSYAALVNKKAVCQGYANLFYQMCLAAGVTNVRVDDGDAYGGSTSGGHAWNLIKMGNKWYYADPTWDAGYSFGQYEYLLRGKTFFDQEHTSCNDVYEEKLNIASDDYSGWLYHNGKFCYRRSDLYFLGNWQKLDGKWYYFGTSGWMYTGWEKISNVWYYFGTDGAMVTGWKKISGKWYYFEASGAMVKGWKKISGKWYYFETSGAMKTGWLKYDGSWYYLDSNGAMVTSTTVRISGKNYKFNSSGVCTNP